MVVVSKLILFNIMECYKSSSVLLIKHKLHFSAAFYFASFYLACTHSAAEKEKIKYITVNYPHSKKTQ